MEVIINSSYGGFNFSEEFGKLIPNDLVDPRTDPRVISLFKEKGSNFASGNFSRLEIVEIPDGSDYEIEEYDDMESIYSFISVSPEALISGLSPERVELAKKVNRIYVTVCE